MKTKLFPLLILCLIVITSCSVKDNDDVNDITQKDPTPSFVPEEYEDSTAETYLNEKEIYVFEKFPVEYALGIIAESDVETTLYLGINGYNPAGKNRFDKEFDLNVIKLNWTLPGTCDADAELARMKSKDPSRIFLDDQQKYLSDEYETNNGNIMKNIYWSEDGCLFSLSVPKEVFEQITSWDMLSLIKTSKIEVMESEKLSSDEEIIIPPDNEDIDFEEDLGPVAAPPIE